VISINDEKIWPLWQKYVMEPFVSASRVAGKNLKSGVVHQKPGDLRCLAPLAIQRQLGAERNINATIMPD
jgi:hypothetical protein